jgi:hypothetical protein
MKNQLPKLSSPFGRNAGCAPTSSQEQVKTKPKRIRKANKPAQGLIRSKRLQAKRQSNPATQEKNHSYGRNNLYNYFSANWADNPSTGKLLGHEGSRGTFNEKGIGKFCRSNSRNSFDTKLVNIKDLMDISINKEIKIVTKPLTPSVTMVRSFSRTKLEYIL